MAIFFGYRTALEYWRCVDAVPLDALSRALPKYGIGQTLDIGESPELSQILSSRGELHIVVPDAKMRSYQKGIVSHVWSPPFDGKHFVKVAPDLYINTPEACFMQLAGSTDPIELAEIGLELCGTYALGIDDDRQMRERPPVTSTTSLNQCLGKMAGKRGYKNMRAALECMVDGSASPMESILVLLLCLPSSRGGYGLPLPQLNYGIDAKALATGYRFPEKQNFYRVCDLYWPGAKLGVEFDSNAHHSGKDKIAKDADRRSTLGLAHVGIITLTAHQVFDARAFDRSAQLIARKLGTPLRIRRKDWMTRRFELREKLLEPR